MQNSRNWLLSTGWKQNVDTIKLILLTNVYGKKRLFK